MSQTPGAAARLWRVRKLHRHIDAEIHGDARPELRLIYGDRIIYQRLWTTRAEAEADGDAKLADLERAGWVEHW